MVNLWKWTLCLLYFTFGTCEETKIEVFSKEIDLRLQPETERLKLPTISNGSIKLEQVANLDEYTDILLKELSEFMQEKGLTVLDMPDLENVFKWKVGFITYTGRMNLIDGKLMGLESLVRSQTVTLSYEYPIVSLVMPLSFNSLQFRYSYTASFMGVGPSGTMNGQTKGTTFKVEMKMDLVRLRVTMQVFELQNLGSVSLKFDGNLLTDFMANVFVQVTIPFIKPELTSFLESTIGNGLESAVNSYNQAVCNFLDDCP